MNGRRLMMMELELEDMMEAVVRLAVMMVDIKKNPNLLRIVPPDHEMIVIACLEAVVHLREKNKRVTPEEDEAEAAKLEQSIKMFQEVMAKAAGK